MNEFFSPENYVKNSSKTEKSREVMLAERGISFDAKGRAVFKASQFIRYAMMIPNKTAQVSGSTTIRRNTMICLKVSFTQRFSFISWNRLMKISGLTQWKTII